VHLFSHHCKLIALGCFKSAKGRYELRPLFLEVGKLLPQIGFCSFLTKQLLLKRAQVGELAFLLLIELA
jgi:hypothetical protein